MPHGEVRTRFAPSPTGYMHIGNLRTALYTYLIAKHLGGKFILRIEDTDQERFIEGATEVIYKTLRTCGLTHDEGPDIGGPVGPYIQTERRELYGKYADLLIEKGGAYRCFCRPGEGEITESVGGSTIKKHKCGCAALSPAEQQRRLDAGECCVIRQRIPAEGSTTFSDVIFGDITVPNGELDENVLIKTDGLPTYNFANVIDDHLMGITHVVRGS
ncbi:MAG: glutamate--tRNA ligase, partial [Clostridiales bacterium]|nr:glutamate--tRNA ligase [Clostridiales bacterium]